MASLKEKLTKLLADYGGFAIGIYVATGAITFLGFAIAISQGFQPEGVAGDLGTIGAAWLAMKLTSPIRIGITLVLTPFAAKVLKRNKVSDASSLPDNNRRDQLKSGPESAENVPPKSPTL